MTTRSRANFEGRTTRYGGNNNNSEMDQLRQAFFEPVLKWQRKLDNPPHAKHLKIPIWVNTQVQAEFDSQPSPSPTPAADTSFQNETMENTPTNLEHQLSDTMLPNDESNVSVQNASQAISESQQNDLESKELTSKQSSENVEIPNIFQTEIKDEIKMEVDPIPTVVPSNQVISNMDLEPTADPFDQVNTNIEDVSEDNQIEIDPNSNISPPEQAAYDQIKDEVHVEEDLSKDNQMKIDPDTNVSQSEQLINDQIQDDIHVEEDLSKDNQMEIDPDTNVSQSEQLTINQSQDEVHVEEDLSKDNQMEIDPDTNISQSEQLTINQSKDEVHVEEDLSKDNQMEIDLDTNISQPEQLTNDQIKDEVHVEEDLSEDNQMEIDPDTNVSQSEQLTNDQSKDEIHVEAKPDTTISENPQELSKYNITEVSDENGMNIDVESKLKIDDQSLEQQTIPVITNDKSVQNSEPVSQAQLETESHYQAPSDFIITPNNDISDATSNADLVKNEQPQDQEPSDTNLSTNDGQSNNQLAELSLEATSTLLADSGSFPQPEPIDYSTAIPSEQFATQTSEDSAELIAQPEEAQTSDATKPSETLNNDSQHIEQAIGLISEYRSSSPSSPDIKDDTAQSTSNIHYEVSTTTKDDTLPISNEHNQIHDQAPTDAITGDMGQSAQSDLADYTSIPYQPQNNEQSLSPKIDALDSKSDNLLIKSTANSEEILSNSDNAIKSETNTQTTEQND